MKHSLFFTAMGMLSLFLASPCLAAAPGLIVVAPLRAPGPDPVYPRLLKFPDAKIMARANALLAGQEQKGKSDQADCIAQVREAKQKPGKDTYSTETKVTYMSGHYLTVDAVTSYDCAGPYPTDGAEDPLTIDLATGALLDWKTAFRPGFLSGAHAGLTQLYRARYATLNKDKDCQGAIRDEDPFADRAILRLDFKKGVVIAPDLAHAIAACAAPMALSPAELAPYLRKTDLLADLQANVK